MSFCLRRAFMAAASLLFLSAASALAAGEAAQTAPAPDPAKVVANVNGQDITEADLVLAEGDLEQQFSQLPAEKRRAAALSAMIEIRLLSQKAAEESLDKDAAFQQRMAFLRERALHSALIDRQVTGAISEEEVRARYDQEISNTPAVNEIHARHILVKTKEEADAIVKQLDGGADFAKLAGENTTDPSGKTSGGDLGWFAPGQMVPEFEKAAFGLEVGTYTKEPIQTQFGWHVIKVEDKRVQQPPAFEEVKTQVRSLLVREKYFALVKSLRDGAKIDIADPALKQEIEGAAQGQQ